MGKEIKTPIKKFIKLAMKNLENNQGCGGWCVRCALGNSIDKYGKEEDMISPEKAIAQLLSGDIRAVSNTDFLMVETRNYLKSFGDEKMVFATKNEVLSFLKKALFEE